MKDRNTDEESVSKGGLIPHKYPMCFIEGPFMLTGLRRTRRYLGAKELGQAYDQPEQVLSLIRNDATRPIALPFLTHIPRDPYTVPQIDHEQIDTLNEGCSQF